MIFVQYTLIWCFLQIITDWRKDPYGRLWCLFVGHWRVGAAKAVHSRGPPTCVMTSVLRILFFWTTHLRVDWTVRKWSTLFWTNCIILVKKHNQFNLYNHIYRVFRTSFCWLLYFRYFFTKKALQVLHMSCVYLDFLV